MKKLYILLGVFIIVLLIIFRFNALGFYHEYIKGDTIDLGGYGKETIYDVLVDGEDKYPAGWGDVDDNESIRAVHAGLDAGIDFYDTAANYGAGHSEVILSKALAGRRDKVVIATKFGHLVNEETKEVQNGDDQILENVRKDIENSLRRLNTDYVDIYQLHAAGYDPVPSSSGCACYRS